MEKDEMITEMDVVTPIHDHTPANVKRSPIDIDGQKVVFALDTLPIPYEKKETGEKYPYEMTAFGTDEKGEIDYGCELLTEHYKTDKEALKRYIEILSKVRDGYELSQIPPQGHSIEVIKEDTQLDGVKLSPYDTVMKDEKDQAVVICKTSKSVGQMEVFDIYACPFSTSDTLDGFVKTKNEDGKNMWKATPMGTWDFYFGFDAMKRAALDEYTKDKVKEVEQTLTNPDKEYVAMNKELVFLKSVDEGERVVSEAYKPMDGQQKGMYKHYEFIQKWDGCKGIDRGPTALSWDTLEKRNQENFEKIAEAKQKKILHLPEKVMHMMPNQLKELRNNPEMTIKPKREQAVVIGPKRPGSDKGMQM